VVVVVTVSDRPTDRPTDRPPARQHDSTRTLDTHGRKELLATRGRGTPESKKGIRKPPGQRRDACLVFKRAAAGAAEAAAAAAAAH
jgi:hypothetical protein